MKILLKKKKHFKKKNNSRENFKNKKQVKNEQSSPTYRYIIINKRSIIKNYDKL